MKKIAIFLLLLFSSCVTLAEYVWLSTVPKELRLLSPGLVMVGNYGEISRVTCATNPAAVFLPNTDPQFDMKVSMALSAQAQGKTIQFLVNNIDDPNTCRTISAHGDVATVFDYYWYIK